MWGAGKLLTILKELFIAYKTLNKDTMLIFDRLNIVIYLMI